MIEIIENFQAHIFSDNRILIAMMAMILVTVFGMLRGPLGGQATPLFWDILDILFGRLGGRMDKPNRLKGDLIFRGFILTCVILIIGFLMGRLLDVMAFYYPHYSVIEILSLSILLVSGTVFVGIGRLYRALNEKKVTQGAYYTIARSTRTDLSQSDDYTITRVGMGMSLKFFDKGIVAPLLWYLLFGLVGAYIYATLAFMSWRFGREGYNSGFGQVMIELEKLMGFIPNLLSGLLIAFAGLLTPTAGMSRAFLGLMTAQGSARYAEGGLPVTAAAYALNVSLGGPTTDLDGKAVKRGWVGPVNATAQLQAKHLHRVTYICFMAHLLFLVSLGSLLLFSA